MLRYLFIPSAGIEPAFQAPQACVLSTERRGVPGKSESYPTTRNKKTKL